MTDHAPTPASANVYDAIAAAEVILPGTPALGGEQDPRWQAIIEVAEYVHSHPEAVWAFTERWGRSENQDLRDAIGTCVLEHLLEHHFELLFPRVESLALSCPRFASTFGMCWKIGQSTVPDNESRFDVLHERLRDAQFDDGHRA